MNPPKRNVERLPSTMDLLDEVIAVDFKYLWTREESLLMSRIREAALRTSIESKRRIILIYNLSGISNEDVARMLRIAIKAGCGDVRLELPTMPLPSSDFVEFLFAEGAQEVHLMIGEPENMDNSSWACGCSVIELETMINELSETNRSNVCVKIYALQDLGFFEMMLRRIVQVGAPRIIVMAEGLGNTGDTTYAKRLCGQLVQQHNVCIDLRLKGSTAIYKTDVWREREAESLLLDIPSAYINGEKTPLGAVFQLGFKCNQKCIFCSGDSNLPLVPEATMRKTLIHALNMKIPRVVFTGGEPTMDPNLTSYISSCKKACVSEISLYTNGMALSDKKYSEEMVEAGLDLALVSLHSPSQEISDRITRRRGGFKKTVEGIHNLLDYSILTIINFVMNEMNFKDAPKFVAFVKNNFPNAILNISYAAPIQPKTAKKEVLPQFSVAAPYLMEALDACDELGVIGAGLEPHWGVPPCVIRADRRYFPFLYPLAISHSGFTKPDNCSRCSLNASCFGVRINYANLYGFSELIPQ